MKIKSIIPLNGHVYVEPVEKKQVLVSDSGRLETFGKVISLPLAHGSETSMYAGVSVGDYVAFELWDVKGVSQGDKKFYMVRADELICKIELDDILE